MQRTALPVALLVLLSIGFPVSVRAEEAGKPFLHPLFSDDAVLQRDVPIAVWGWTEPGKQVTVALNRRKAEAVADNQGKWIARLEPMPAGGPYAMIVSGPTSVTRNNVLIGDVWICSGQSNMEWGIGAVNHASEEIAAADHPQIRLFTVARKIALEPETTVGGRWLTCSPRHVAEMNFSAVAYFFGRKLHQELKVPIGLIHSSWGGTVAEAWTSAQALETLPDFQPAVEKLKRAAEEREQGATSYAARVDAWWQKNDPGSASASSWANPTFDDHAWKTMDLPQSLERGGLPDFDGVVWFRKEVDVPETWKGKDLFLHLGPIDDIDTTWFNGTRVGGKDRWNDSRDYKVPASAVKPGRNVIAVRVLDLRGEGGIRGEADQLKLEPAGGSSSIGLAGPWKYRDSSPMRKLSAYPERFEENPNAVTVLYNGMIAPLVPFAIKGAIWYQGESNVGRAAQYQQLLPTMIGDWRSRFGVGDFPFFIVQLANFLPVKPEPSESGWAELREAQSLITKRVPKTGLAVTIDIGEAGDIHPRNKQDVGLRLALSALSVAYNQPIESSGPSFRAMKVEGNKVRLSFDHLGGGLAVRGGGKLEGFAIAGEDRHFVWADAAIEGIDVVVSSPKVDRPVAVRYAWADNPVCNLTNRTGLPAVPFRTDVPPPRN